MPTSTLEKRLLLFGASRGLGLAIAEEYLKLGWRLVATVRSGSAAEPPLSSEMAKGGDRGRHGPGRDGAIVVMYTITAAMLQSTDCCAEAGQDSPSPRKRVI